MLEPSTPHEGLKILYLDNHVLCINKPPGLLSQGDSTGDPSVVLLGKQYLKQKFAKPGNVFLALVHRLDRPASGAMVLARTSKAASRLSAAFRERRVDKRYLALVCGRLKGRGEWEDWLIKERPRVQVVESTAPRGKIARLRWRAGRIQGGCTIVDVELETGRPHQIRCQFGHRGYPILGDIRYSATREFDGRNLALHCYRLSVPHPTTRVTLDIEAPLPRIWSEFASPGMLADPGLDVVCPPKVPGSD